MGGTERRAEHVDAVVVGGGPSGSTAATLIARAGNRVIQLEKHHHPRHQIGESLLPSTIHGVCRLLGVREALHRAGFQRKNGGTFRWGVSDEPWTFAFSELGPTEMDYAYQVERARFDQLLFEHGRAEGVDAREGIEVLRPIQNGGHVRGVVARDAGGQVYEMSARYVVDASGHASRLQPIAGRRVYSKLFRGVAVFGYFHGAARQDPPNEGNIITCAFEYGWCWFIPLSNGLTSVGAVVSPSRARRIAIDREAALRWFVDQCPIISDKLTHATRVTEGIYGQVRVRKDWSYTNESFTAPGLVVAGDAACFIDPVFSTGVHLGTYAGMLAARTINTVLAGGIDADRCAAEYERRYRAEFRLFYEFLIAFYDMRQPWESYYWTARNLLGTQERSNHAMIRLVAGGATAPEEFFAERAGSGLALAGLVRDRAQAADDDARERLREDLGGLLSGHDASPGDIARSVGAGLRRLALVSDVDDDRDGSAGSLAASSDGLYWVPT